MSMTVLLELTLKPDAENAEAVIRETLAQTAAREGQEGLEVLVDDADPLKLVVVETWRSTEDHAAYDAWRQTPEGASDLGSIISYRNKRIFSHTIQL